MSFSKNALQFYKSALAAGLILTFSQSGVRAQDTTAEFFKNEPLRIQPYAPDNVSKPLATLEPGELNLQARLIEDGPVISSGLTWRVFSQEKDKKGKFPLVATAKGGSAQFQLEAGSYLVHAAFGRAGATKRITVDSRQKRGEEMVLDAGGLKLDAMLSGGAQLDSNKLRFSIYEMEEDANGQRALIIPDVKPNKIVRLSANTYHVVSHYGAVNAVIRSDIHVKAGKLTEATVEHRAAQLTLKLVRETGGEAIADTAWVITTTAGDIVRESVGAFAEMVLAAGNYTIIAKNRDRIYQRDFTVVAGRNQDVEVIAIELE